MTKPITTVISTLSPESALNNVLSMYHIYFLVGHAPKPIPVPFDGDHLTMEWGEFTVNALYDRKTKYLTISLKENSK